MVLPPKKICPPFLVHTSIKRDICSILYIYTVCVMTDYIMKFWYQKRQILSPRIARATIAMPLTCGLAGVGGLGQLAFVGLVD